MSFAEAPEGQRPPGGEALEMRGPFSCGPDAPFMGCDVPREWGKGGMGDSSVFHAATDAAEARRAFDALAEGGDW